MKRLLGFLLAFGFLLVGCDNTRDTPPEFPPNIFQGVVEAVYEGSILVKDIQGGNIGDKASLSLKNIDEDTRAKLKVGETVTVTFSGEVLETYPVQIPDVLRIVVEEDTEHIIREYDFSSQDHLHTSWVNWPDDGGDKMWEIASKHPQLSLSAYHHWPVVTVRSVKELEDFVDFCDGYLALGASYNEVGSFKETAKKFDEEFFKQRGLCLILVTSGSGSDRFFVEDVSGMDDELYIEIGCNSPEVGTCDMAGWLLTVEMAQSDLDLYRYFIAR